MSASCLGEHELGFGLLWSTPFLPAMYWLSCSSAVLSRMANRSDLLFASCIHIRWRLTELRYSPWEWRSGRRTIADPGRHQWQVQVYRWYCSGNWLRRRKSRKRRVQKRSSNKKVRDSNKKVCPRPGCVPWAVKSQTRKYFFLLHFQTPVTLYIGEWWYILVVRQLHSADLRSRLRHAPSAPSVANSTVCTQDGHPSRY